MQRISWQANDCRSLLQPMAIPEDASVSGERLAGTLFLYFDESGNFDFGPKGTKYFIMTCLATMRPFSACHELMDAKYDCFEAGLTFKKFHATEDKENTRKTVYGIISKHQSRYAAYSVYVDKGDLDENMRSAPVLYSELFKQIIDEVFESDYLSRTSKIIAVTDDIPKEADKRRIVKPLKLFLKKKSEEFGISSYLEHYPSESDFNLQIVDYLCWAHKRYMDGKEWPYSKVKEAFAETAVLKKEKGEGR